MKAHRAVSGALVGITLALAWACGNSQQTAARSPQPAATPTQGSGQPGDVAEKIGDKAKEVGDKVAEGAKDAGAKLQEGAKELGAEAAVQKQVLDVKAALMADKAIDASRIDVDGDAATKTLTLKGTVPSGAHKTAAEKLARDKAEGYKIRNQLTVAAK
jgi:osmotically-inducible protein OsmY